MPDQKSPSQIRTDAPGGGTIEVRGMTSLEKNKFVRVKYDRKSALVSYKRFGWDKSGARQELSDKGLDIVSDRDWRAVIDVVADIKSFPRYPIIEHPGWNGSYYAFTNGKVAGPRGHPRGEAIFKPDKERVAHRGSYELWRDEVASLLVGQTIPSFMLMAALTAPILLLSGRKDNVGFEISGEGETGKSTCQRLMASTIGSANYVRSFYATHAGLEQEMEAHADAPMIIDENNLFGAGEASGIQQERHKGFAFLMANGMAKRRFNSPETKKNRLVYMTSANKPFYEVLNGAHRETALAALDRLIPIRVRAESKLGIFDALPKGYTSARQLAQHLDAAILEQHGTAFPRFLKCLINDRAEDEDGLKRSIRNCVTSFESEIAVAGSRGGGNRVSEAFGLVYAAGSFAKRHGILPADMDCLEAVVQCYRNYRASVPDKLSLAERLNAIVSRPETRVLRRGKWPTMTDEDVELHGAFVRPGNHGTTELLLTARCRDRFIPDLKAIRSTDEFIRLHIGEKSHPGKMSRITIKRQIRKNVRSERLTCFALPKAVSAAPDEDQPQ